jgi:hypothetical protein
MFRSATANMRQAKPIRTQRGRKKTGGAETLDPCTNTSMGHLDFQQKLCITIHRHL